MPRGKRINSSLICKDCGEQNYTSRLKRDKIKEYNRKRFCNSCRKHTEHKAKEIKGGY